MKILIKISLALATIFLLNACSKVPVTGRRQFNLLPESQLMGMSFTQYQDVLAQSKILPENDNRVIMVKRVGDKIAQAAQKYLDSHNQSKRTKGFEWEFNVIE